VRERRERRSTVVVGCILVRLLSEGFRGLKLENVVNAAVDGEVVLS
jgi:hypothetical protein